jgi:hypothetical protein
MATVFPDLLENEHDGTYPTHPRVARRELSPHGHQMSAILVGGGENRGILSVGRLLKILIKLGLIFNIKLTH